MDCAKIIQETQDYIAQNLFEPLSAEALAGRVGFSHYYFCKLFSFYTGMPVMEYIRRARLAHAAHEICAGKRILDVALECGFESHGGFSKAFKKIYSYSPEEYRRRAGRHRPPAPNPLKNVEKDFAVATPKATVLEKEGFYIAGIILRTSPDINSVSSTPAVWSSTDLWELENKIYATAMPEAHGEYYVAFPVAKETFRLVAAVKITDPEDVSPSLYVDYIEGGLYAVFSLPPVFGNSDAFATAVTQAWRYIYEEWLPASDYSIDQARLDYEFYDERCHGDGPYSMDIYIPITKR